MSSQNSSSQSIATGTARILKPMLEEKLKETAQTAGWPPNIVNAISIDFNGDDLLVKYPEELSDEIDDLEYGKPYSVPKAAIRPFIYSSEAYIKDVLAVHALGMILDAEEVI
jgi:hypothetical protein